MKKLIVASLSLLFALGLVVSLTPASAIADGFNQNHIIDDAVFDNTAAMSAAQIDNWINVNFGATSCISTSHGFSAPDPIGYNPTQGFLYGGNVSAGQVIYDAAQAYGINPQVLLTTLQKEQSLVSGSAGCSTLAYAAATGYGCPDGGTTYNYSGVNLGSINGVQMSSVSGTCVNTSIKVGFSQQVIRAAWLLKFGEQRSEGNFNWAVIKGGWNNSDDPQTCYGGPMTQGTWQICPSGGSSYYDGYTPIDGTSVHMDNGATAALYWYTPHFSGNQHFYDIFTSWFGSTQFPQPLGGELLYQISTGNIFLVTEGTRYYIPDWNMMVNYGLDHFPSQPSSDSTINSYTDGGALTNLIYLNGSVYLVNNQSLYYLSPSSCLSWGLECSNSNIVKTLGQVFQSDYLKPGWALSNLAASNNIIYEMNNGARNPIANPQTLNSLGLSTNPILVTSSVNSSQPLGPLVITTPGVISFPPNQTIYYYDGSNYYDIPNMTIYRDWSLQTQPVVSGPTSSYNYTPPTSLNIGSWYLDGSGNKFIISNGSRVQIPSSLQSLWQSQVFSSTQPSALANSLPSIILSKFVWIGSTIYTLDSNGKHYIPNWSSYLALGGNSGNSVALSPDKLSMVSQGNDALGDGIIVSLQDGSNKLYVINNGNLVWISSPGVFNAYGFSWSNILSYPSNLAMTYPVDTTSLSIGKYNDIYYIPANNKLYYLTPNLASDFGLIISRSQDITSNLLNNSHGTPMSRLLYDTNTGNFYYASGGAIHYIATYSAFVAYGGTQTTPTIITTGDLANFLQAQPLY